MYKKIKHNNDLDTISLINIPNKSMTDIATMINPKTAFGICQINNKYFIIGGWPNNQDISKCEVFNINTKSSKQI